MKNFLIPDTLKVGELYTNDQIVYSLEVGNLGGIRPRVKNGVLEYIVLITSSEEKRNASRNPYSDKIEGDILTYTGAGLKGDQEISGVNKRILEQSDKPVPILGFVREGKGQYKFIGFLFLLRSYQDFQIDNLGELRKVWLFEFQIFSDLPEIKVETLIDPFVPLYEKFKKEVLPDDKVIESLLSEKREGNGDLVEINEESVKNIENLKVKLLTINPYEFEKIMADLILHTGFINVNVTKKSGDDGVDVNALLRQSFSLDLKFQFQIKRWKHSVGRNEVANLRGSLGFNSFGVIISTSHFTSSAINESQGVGKAPINLVGMKELYDIILKTKFSFKSNPYFA